MFKFRKKLDCFYLYFEIYPYWFNKYEHSKIFDLEIATGRPCTDEMGLYGYRYVSLEFTLMSINLYLRVSSFSPFLYWLREDVFSMFWYTFRYWRLQIGLAKTRFDIFKPSHFWDLLSGIKPIVVE